MKVLFICLGNICRSPLAEGLFRKHIEDKGLGKTVSIDSCGTGGWHAGELADPRMRQTAKSHGIELKHRARQLTKNDFQNFDHLLVMDNQNLKDVINVSPESSSKVKLITDYSLSFKGKEIPDPYFGELDGFEEVFELLNKVSFELAEYFYPKA